MIAWFATKVRANYIWLLAIASDKPQSELVVTYFILHGNNSAHYTREEEMDYIKFVFVAREFLK